MYQSAHGALIGERVGEATPIIAQSIYSGSLGLGEFRWFCACAGALCTLQMVVQVESRIRYSSKRMDTNQTKVEANILLLGAENVGKSGECAIMITVCHVESSGLLTAFRTGH